jgi:hypothetical protein
MMNFRRTPSRSRRSALACEALEPRLVLTYAGPSSLLGSLSYVGVVTTPIETRSLQILPPMPPTPANAIAPVSSTVGAGMMWTKLRADLQALETELQTLAAKSGVTIADLQNLTNDSQAIAHAGLYFQASTLNPVVSELATAVAGQTDTSQAHSDFTGLFSSSSVSSMTVTNTFLDLVKAIQDSAVTTTDLSTVAADEAAIQSDLPKIPSPIIPVGEAWLDQVGSAPATLSLASAVTSPMPALASPVLPVVPQPIIVSPFGGLSLLGALSSVGVITSPVFLPPNIVLPEPISVPPMQTAAAALTVLPSTPTTSSGAWAQLQADVQKLHTELQSLAEKSGLTITDEQNLTNDAHAIAQAGFRFKASTLHPVISELAMAVGGMTSTSRAQTDFAALFGGSSVSATTITNTFNDLVTAIQHSAVLTTDLSTVAADKAAIQTDLKNLFPGKTGGSGTGGGGSTTGTRTIGSTGSGSTVSFGGQTKNRGHRHKPHHPAHVPVKAAKVKHAAKVAHAHAKTAAAHAAKELTRLKKR